jgi:thioredoxin reductase (NADPH)
LLSPGDPIGYGVKLERQGEDTNMAESTGNFDVVICGSGPAGLQAAVHAARSRASVAVLGRIHKSSLYKAHVENFCCIEAKQSGLEILEQGRRQAERFGATFHDVDVLDIGLDSDGGFHLVLESGERVRALSVVLAMGISRNRLNVPGEKELLGRGVSYCVDCDGNFFRDQLVVVVGNESAACAGALNLLLIAAQVHLVYRELNVNEHLRYQVERSMIVKHPGRWIKEIVAGTGGVEGVALDNGELVKTQGLFIELGAKGAMELATKLGVALDAETMQFIAVDRKQQTSVPGVYAAGDICGLPWQMAKAVGEGCVAGLEAAAHAKKKRP